MTTTLIERIKQSIQKMSEETIQQEVNTNFIGTELIICPMCQTSLKNNGYTNYQGKRVKIKRCDNGFCSEEEYII